MPGISGDECVLARDAGNGRVVPVSSGTVIIPTSFELWTFRVAPSASEWTDPHSLALAATRQIKV